MQELALTQALCAEWNGTALSRCTVRCSQAPNHMTGSAEAKNHHADAASIADSLAADSESARKRWIFCSLDTLT